MIYTLSVITNPIILLNVIKQFSREFSCGTAWDTAVALVQSLTWEVPHAMGVAKKKNSLKEEFVKITQKFIYLV